MKTGIVLKAVPVTAALVFALALPAQAEDSTAPAEGPDGGGGLCTPVPGAAPSLAGFAYAVQSDGDDQLYQLDLQTGQATAIGPVGFGDVECLAFAADGTLFAVDDSSDQVITIDVATGAGTAVGPIGVALTDCGLAFDGAGDLYMSVDAPDPFNLHEIDPATGAATVIGPQGQRVTGLTWGNGNLYGLGGDSVNNLVILDRTTGAATPVGGFGGSVDVSDGGLDFDGNGVLWGIEDGGCIFVLDPATGTATPVATTSSGFEGLAIAPQALIQAVPALSGAGRWVLFALIGGAAILLLRRR